MSKWKRTAVIISLSIFFLLFHSGCGLFYYVNESAEHKAMRKQGYELCHLQSCGPEALSDSFKYLGIDKTPFEIGKEIQDADQVHYRGVLSIVHHDFTEITCPPELLKYCRANDIKITTVTDINDLQPGIIAIALIRGKSDLRDWHYICYPEYKKIDILSYFGEDTKFIKAYCLSR